MMVVINQDNFNMIVREREQIIVENEQNITFRAQMGMQNDEISMQNEQLTSLLREVDYQRFKIRRPVVLLPLYVSSKRRATI